MSYLSKIFTTILIKQIIKYDKHNINGSSVHTTAQRIKDKNILYQHRIFAKQTTHFLVYNSKQNVFRI